MKVLSQYNSKIVNVDNVIEIKIENKCGDDEEIHVVKESSILARGYNCGINLGTYATEARAKEILLDIYSKLSENKTVYKMPIK